MRGKGLSVFHGILTPACRTTEMTPLIMYPHRHCSSEEADVVLRKPCE